MFSRFNPMTETWDMQLKLSHSCRNPYHPLNYSIPITVKAVPDITAVTGMKVVQKNKIETISNISSFIENPNFFLRYVRYF